MKHILQRLTDTLGTTLVISGMQYRVFDSVVEGLDKDPLSENIYIVIKI